MRADLERPYSIQELMVLHNLSRRQVVRLYENEPGILVIEKPPKLVHIRRHRTIRVPEVVFRRVRHRLEQ